jgi:hypothetical protein
MAENQINVQPPAMGYGSYLSSILPPDVAVAAGAFASAMGQIKNIRNNPIEKFAQVVTNLETTIGLPLINGTSVPTNLSLRTQVRPKLALGSGPQGTYNMSDFFGCASGLPYNGSAANPSAGKLNPDGWYNVFNKLKQLETSTLYTIYEQLYLAITWEQATFSVTTEQQSVETSPGVYDWQYRITGTTMTNSGGGYTRNGAPAPGGDYTFSDGTLASSGGVTLTANPDTDSDNIATYGRMVNLSVTGTPGSWVTYATGQSSPTPTSPGLQYRLPAPPITYSVYPYTGASNSAYGTSGWPGMNSVVQNLIDDANTEINGIYSSNQTACRSLNASWNQTGAQLTVEQRARQAALRPPLDDLVREDYLSVYPTSLETWVDSLGTYGKNVEPHMTAQTIEAISDWSLVGGQSIVGTMRENRNQDRLTAIGVSLDNNISSMLTAAQQSALIANGSLPTSTVNTNIPAGSDIADPSTNIPGEEYTGEEYTGDTNSATNETIVDDVTISSEPDGYLDEETGLYIVITDGTPEELDIGEAIFPGSFAGSPYSKLIPPNLNNWYASNTLLPNTYTVQEAIDEVIRCNCDCWEM